MIFDNLYTNSLLLKTDDFGENFFWGMSSNEYNIAKKELSPLFLNTKYQVPTIDESFYKAELEKYKQDIDLTKKLGISNYRFSLSWSRILPDGVGKINTRAIRFYHDILAICMENSIEPFVTLYDSCLPVALEKQGGWSNREVLHWFENYVAICVDTFKGNINYWIVLNEPSVFTGAGCFLGMNSSGKKSTKSFLSALHHALLCQSIGFKTIKKIAANAQVGSFFSCHYIISNTYNDKDIKAVERIDALLNRAFIEPSLGLGYPINELPFLKNLSKYILLGDDELIKVNFDFIGLQNCTRKIVSHNSFVPYLNAKIIQYDKIRVKKNHLNCHIYHELIYLIIKKYSKYEGVKKILIVENVSLPFDKVDCDDVIGIQKTNDIQSFLNQMLLAKRNGCKVNGYFLSILEEFKT
jgi:beta-glucosidase